jgi:hypothetical protein
MPKDHSGDLRERVIETVEAGGVAARGGAHFAAGRARGRDLGSDIAEQPDLTLVETVGELRKRRIRRSLLAFSQPTQHHAQKKSLQAAE